MFPFLGAFKNCRLFLKEKLVTGQPLIAHQAIPSQLLKPRVPSAHTAGTEFH